MRKEHKIGSVLFVAAAGVSAYASNVEQDKKDYQNSIVPQRTHTVVDDNNLSVFERYYQQEQQMPVEVSKPDTTERKEIVIYPIDNDNKNNQGSTAIEDIPEPFEQPNNTSQPVNEEPTQTIEVESIPTIFQPNPKLDMTKMNLEDSDKSDLNTWRDLIEWLADYYGWDANLAAAQMKLESDFINGLTSDQGAVGLWGIMPEINGRPNADVLMDPFYNGTWHFATMIDVCLVQGDTITNTLTRYFGGEENYESATKNSIRVLQIAGYADENGNLLIPNKCESTEKVPEPPKKRVYLNR